MILGSSPLGGIPLGYGASIAPAVNAHICPSVDISISTGTELILWKNSSILIAIGANPIAAYSISATKGIPLGNTINVHTLPSNQLILSFTNSDTVVEGEVNYVSELGLSAIAAIPIAWSRLVKAAALITSFTAPGKEIVISSSASAPYVEEDIDTYVNPDSDITITAVAGETTRYRSPPVSICSGYTFDGTSITIPLACLPGLTALEADAVSGDWGDIFQSILLMSDDWITNLGIEIPVAYDSFYLQNMNAKKSFFEHGIGEHNLFLEKFTVTYAASKLKAEN